MKRQFLSPILIFVAGLILLLPGFYRNKWNIVEPARYEYWQITVDRTVVARLVKSRQDGIFSDGGLLGLGDVKAWNFLSRTNRHQYSIYIANRSFKSYFPYRSHPGFQAIPLSLFDKMTNLSETTNLRVFRGVVALSSAMIMALLAVGFGIEFGWLGAILTGTLIFGFGGLAWGVLLIAFFLPSSWLTRYKATLKADASVAFAKGGARDVGQVLANGGVASLVAVMSGVVGPSAALSAAFVGALAEASADTWATEVGLLARQTPRLITTGRSVAAGTSGGVTGLGTLAALGGAAWIGGLAALLQGDWRLLPLGAAGGFTGALFDSLLGATVQAMYYSERRGKETEKPIDADGTPNRHVRGWQAMTNDAVNGLSTFVGALASAVLSIIL